jgi:hypothetical protein
MSGFNISFPKAKEDSLMVIGNLCNHSEEISMP